MAVERSKRRSPVDLSNSDVRIVSVTADGHLEWVTPKGAAPPAVSEEAGQQPVSQVLHPDVLSVEDAARIRENRKRLEELRHERVGSPDLGDIVREIAEMSDYGLDFAVAAWILAGIGVLPVLPLVAAGITADVAIDTGKYVVHRLHHSALVEGQDDGDPKELWKSHPGIAASIAQTVMQRVVDSIVDAASVDDTEIEDELDHFYPRWSQTDFEFDPRHTGSRPSHPKKPQGS